MLCGINPYTGEGTYTAEGITKLCEGLKGSCVTSLRYAAAPKRSRFCQRPLTHLLSHRSHPAHRACSIAHDRIGAEGASTLATILKETQIQKLECAAAPERSLLCQRPLTALSTLPCSHGRSLSGNRLGSEGGAALAEGLKGNTTLQSLT